MSGLRRRRRQGNSGHAAGRTESNNDNTGRREAGDRRAGQQRGRQDELCTALCPRSLDDRMTITKLTQMKDNSRVRQVSSLHRHVCVYLLSCVRRRWSQKSTRRGGAAAADRREKSTRDRTRPHRRQHRAPFAAQRRATALPSGESAEARCEPSAASVADAAGSQLDARARPALTARS